MVKSLGQLLFLLRACLKLMGLLLLIVVWVPMLPVIGLLAWTWLGPGSPPACSPDASANAPGGGHVALAMSCVSTMYIGGADMWNEVRVCAPPLNGRCQTVYAANSLPAIAWADGRTLTIAVDDGDGYLRVFSSLHSAFDVAVAYHVTRSISEEDFRKKVEDYGQRLAVQDSPEFIRKWSQDYLDDFHAFQAWARANAGQPGQ